MGLKSIQRCDLAEDTIMEVFKAYCSGDIFGADGRESKEHYALMKIAEFLGLKFVKSWAANHGIIFANHGTISHHIRMQYDDSSKLFLFCMQICPAFYADFNKDDSHENLTVEQLLALWAMADQLLLQTLEDPMSVSHWQGVKQCLHSILFSRAGINHSDNFASCSTKPQLESKLNKTASDPPSDSTGWLFSAQTLMQTPDLPHPANAASVRNGLNRQPPSSRGSIFRRLACFARSKLPAQFQRKL